MIKEFIITIIIFIGFLIMESCSKEGDYGEKEK